MGNLKLLESGTDREGCKYTIKGSRKKCVLHCVHASGATSFMLVGSYDYVKQFI